MKKVMLSGLLLAAASGSLAAQQDGITSRVVAALDTKFIDAICPLKGSDFRVNSAKIYLKTATENADPEIRRAKLADGQRVLLEDLASAGQSKVAAPWYYLGRVDLMKGDLVGADSAFTKAEELAPQCKEDIGKYRYRTWAALVNAGITFSQAHNEDSALVAYRAAHLIQRTNPLGFSNMAKLFNSKSQNDSALVYFQRAADITPADDNQTKLRNEAAYDVGVVHLQEHHYPEAVTAFRRYLGWVPNDAQAMKGLAASFRGTGQTDSAKAVEAAMTGGAAAATGDGEGLTAGDLFDLGVRQFNDKDYKTAAETFGKVLEKTPYNRDALFNQGNSYLGALKNGTLGDSSALIKAAKRLVELEPLAEFDLKLLILLELKAWPPKPGHRL